MAGRELIILILAVHYCSGVNYDKISFTITSIAPCDLKDRTVDNNSGIFVTTSIKRVSRQTSLTKIVANVTKTTAPLTFSVRGYSMAGNTKHLLVQGPNKTCNFVMVGPAIAALGLKFDKSCRLAEGVYKTENLDLNKFKSIMEFVVQEYGKYAFEIEYATAKGVAGCLFCNYELLKVDTRKPKKNVAMV